MNKSYDVYMCRPDNRPLLTVYKLQRFQNTHVGGWHMSVDVHTAIKRAKDAGYKIPPDIYQDYLAYEHKRKVEALEVANAANKSFYEKGMTKKILDWLRGK